MVALVVVEVLITSTEVKEVSLTPIAKTPGDVPLMSVAVDSVEEALDMVGMSQVTETNPVADVLVGAMYNRPEKKITC